MDSYKRPRFFAPSNNYSSHYAPNAYGNAPRRPLENEFSYPYERYPKLSNDTGEFSSRPMYPRYGEQSDRIRPFPGMSSRIPPHGLLPRPELNDKRAFGPPPFMPRMRFPYESNDRVGLPWYHGPEQYAGSFRSPYNNVPPPRFNPQKFRTSKEKKKLKKAANRKMNEKNDGKKLKPWMTDEIYAEVKKKKALYIKAKQDNTTETWQEFRLQRNRVSSLVKEAKFKGGFLIRKKKDESEEDQKEKPFSCDTCDRAFVEENELNEHVKDHVKCEIDGCQFEAHAKVVELHKKMQHETGFADVIQKLDNEEEIEKWRNERKKHFPTAENIKKRQAEQEEKEARGEILETKEFGKFKKRGGKSQSFAIRSDRNCSSRFQRGNKRNQRGRIRSNRLGHRWQTQEKFNISNTLICSESDSDDEEYIKLKRFEGTCSLTPSSSKDEFSSLSFENVQYETNMNQKDTPSEIDVPGDIQSLAQFEDFQQNVNENVSLVQMGDGDCGLESSLNAELLPKTNLGVNVSLDVPQEPSDISFSNSVMQNESSNYKSADCNKAIELNLLEKTVNDSETLNINTENNKTLKADPLSYFLADGIAEDTDDDSPPENLPVERKPDLPESLPTVLGGALGDLMTTYNSCSEQELESTALDKRKICHNIENKGSVKLGAQGSNHQELTKMKRQGKPSTIRYSQNSILEKLLANEIRHERNVMLQCIRYIIRNDFFGAGKKANATLIQNGSISQIT